MIPTLVPIVLEISLPVVTCLLRSEIDTIYDTYFSTYCIRHLFLFVACLLRSEIDTIYDTYFSTYCIRDLFLL